MGKLINGGISIKVALSRAVENTTLRERFFTTPCALQVRTSAPSTVSGNPWDQGTPPSGARNRPTITDSGKGNQGSSKKQKRNKGGKSDKDGKGSKGKNWNAPDGRQICFAYNNEGCSNRGCARLHVCHRCYGNHPQAQGTVPAASTASSSASASTSAAPPAAKGGKGAGG
jgi:hypothetical protein